MDRVAITAFQAAYGPQQYELATTTVLSEHFSNPGSGHGEKTPLGEELLKVSPLTESDRGSVVIGCSKGQLEYLNGPVPDSFPCGTPDYPAHEIARQYGFTGRVFSPNAACATGAHALALGASLIQNGDADIVLAGAIEYPQHPMILAAYKNMGALSKSGVMRPFAANRDGFIAAHGSGTFLLESESLARRRGATIHGFLTGWSLKCDATHMTAMCPSGATIARAIEEAMKRAGNPQIDYINAHGTATLNDAIEARGIQSVFGKSVPLSSTKALTGHLLGAAGAVEAAICLLALREGFAPPTLNLESPDERL